MHPRFLAATDFSESSYKALALAAQYARRYHGTLHVVHALFYPGHALGHEREDLFWEKATEAANAQLAEAVERHAKQVENIQTHLVEGTPADAILPFADVIGAEIIFAGTQGLRAAGDPFIGTEALRLLRHHKRPLMLVSQLPAPREGQPRVLVPISRTHGVQGLTSFLKHNHMGFQGTFDLLHLVDEAGGSGTAQHFLDRKIAQVQAAGATQVSGSLAPFHPDGIAVSINQYMRSAAEPYDLLSVESRDPGTYGEMLVGGSLEDIILHCKRPVLCLANPSIEEENA